MRRGSPTTATAAIAEREPGGAAHRGARVQPARDLVRNRPRDGLLDRAEQEHGDQEHPGPERPDRAVDLGSERARGHDVERVREHARGERPDRQQGGVALVDRLQQGPPHAPEARAGGDGLRSAHAAPTAAFRPPASRSRISRCHATDARRPSSRPTEALKPRMRAAFSVSGIRQRTSW